MKKNHLKTILGFFIATLLLFVYGRTDAATINVSPGSGTLATALSGATTGSTLVLASGGVYTESSGLTIDSKVITITAESGAATMPVLNIKEFDIKGTGVSLICDNIDIRGTSGASYAVYYVTGFISSPLMRFANCKISGYERSLHRGDNITGGDVDLIEVDNCIVTNIGVVNTTYQTFLTKSGKVNFRNISLTNSTFYNCDGGFIRHESTTKNTNVVIDHCTFNEVMKTANKNFVKMTGFAGNSLTISNSIFTNFAASTGYWSFGNAPTLAISNSFYYGMGSATFESSFTGTKTNFTATDPQYTNAASGNFSIPSTSPAATASNTGGIIGDPRWAPPALSAAPATLSFYYQVSFGPSSKQYFLVNGQRLSGNVSVTAPANYEISLDGATFQETAVSITPTSGTVLNKPVYFRLKGGLAVGEYNGNAVLVSAGATNVNVAFAGKVGSTPPLPNVIINEFYADAVADANNDGAISATNDQFVELYNGGGALVNMSFMKLKVNGVVKHIFPVGTTVPPRASIVVFGGGSIASFTATQAILASSGGLGLPTTGGTITLTNQNDDVIATYTYGAEANNDQSITRDPDGEGAFIQHSTAAFAAGAMLSPGLRNNGLAFSGGISTAVPVNWKYIFAAFLLIGLVVVIRRVRFF